MPQEAHVVIGPPGCINVDGGGEGRIMTKVARRHSIIVRTGNLVPDDPSARDPVDRLHRQFLPDSVEQHRKDAATTQRYRSTDVHRVSLRLGPARQRGQHGDRIRWRRPDDGYGPDVAAPPDAAAGVGQNQTSEIGPQRTRGTTRRTDAVSRPRSRSIVAQQQDQVARMPTQPTRTGRKLQIGFLQ